MAAFLLLAIASIYAQDGPVPAQAITSAQQQGTAAQDTTGDAAADPAAVRPEGRVIRLSDVEGTVSVMAPGDSGFSPAVANMPLQQGFKLQTGGDGKAEVQFEDGSVARLAPGATLAITTLQGADAGDLTTRLTLGNGIGYFELYPQGNSTYAVRVQDVDVTVPNTATFRVDLTAAAPEVAVDTGGVTMVAGSGNPVRVAQGQTATLEDEAFVVNAGIEPGDFDSWNTDRDNQLAQMSANTSDAQQGNDASGWSDLDYYGTYYNVPGVGQVWQPYGYGPDFDPYAQGYWADYGWGPTWISAYPWGWVPFHCGYWNYWNGFGWGWSPADCGIGDWYTDTPIIIGPAGYPRRHRPHYPHPRPGQPRTIRLTPVGIKPDTPLRPAPAHPAPHGEAPRPVTINGRTVMPVPSRPVNEPRTPAGLTGPYGIQHGPARLAYPVNGMRGQNPPAYHGGAASAPHPSAPPPSHSEPSHSDPSSGSSKK